MMHACNVELAISELLCIRRCWYYFLLTDLLNAENDLFLYWDMLCIFLTTIDKVVAFVSVIYAYFMSRLRVARNSQLRITYSPMSAMDEERQANLNKNFNCNDIECVNMLRMCRAPLLNLCNLLRDINLLRDTINCTMEEQVAMFLHVVGHN